MNIEIRPGLPSGTVAAPPAKSMAHRLLICAGLAQGESVIRGIAPSEDILATLDCLRAAGVKADCRDGLVMISGGQWPVPPANAGRDSGEDPGHSHAALPGQGQSEISGQDPAIFPCRESGSTLRFFIPLCLLSGQESLFTGSRRLLERPLSVYEEIARRQGLLFEHQGSALRVRGPLAAGDYSLRGDISSQFISGLLFALPLLDSDSHLRLIPPVESRPYIDLTLSAQKAFGVKAFWADETTLVIPGGQKYLPANKAVEGDWSNAAFFLALHLPVTGLDSHSLQGDKICAAYLQALEVGPALLDLSDCPDLAPVLFAFAALHHGGTFTGTARLAVKESDRGAAMKEELAKFGVSAKIGPNRIVIGSGVHPPRGLLSSHNDHRIVMALTLLCLHTGGVICQAQAVNKSFPDFFAILKNLGADFSVLE